MHRLEDVSDMKDFLESIDCLCDEVRHSWSIGNIDISVIKDIKARINKFALESKSDILSFYTYASQRGRHVIMKYQALVDALCKYEEYNDDLMTFIKALVSDSKITDTPDDNLMENVKQASDADDRFRESLFGKYEKTTFIDSIDNLDTFMCLNMFIDKVNDNFIYLSKKENIPSEKAKALIDLYANSVIEFLQKMLSALTEYIAEARSIVSGNSPKLDEDKDIPYQLI